MTLISNQIIFMINKKNNKNFYNKFYLNKRVDNLLTIVDTLDYLF